MTGRPSDAPSAAGPPPSIYPRRYFDLSRTWHEWNRLTAADIHALRDERGFEGQQIAFALNHPIRFVRVVGLVVDIELTRGGRHTLLALDDGSGACIHARVSARDPEAAGKWPSNTSADSVHVNVALGMPTVLVNGEPIDIGTVLKVKASLGDFMGTRQLRIERAWIVKDTNAEARAWAEAAAWKRERLSSPWVLTPADRATLDQQLQQEDLRQKKKQKARAAYLKKMTRHNAKVDAKLDAERQREELELNAGALAGSHEIAAPWD